MAVFIGNLHPVLQALVATAFTWAMTAAGSAGVFVLKTVNRKLLDTMMGFAAGVMIAASYWSLLEPAVALSRGLNIPVWIPAVSGFLIGGVCLRLVDRILPHLHVGFSNNEIEGVKTGWHRSTLLIMAITLHNIPEGLAVGVAFGSLAVGSSEASIASAMALAVGIGIQNFPEGMAVSMPLLREGLSRRKSFFWGQLSGLVEPVAGVLGALLVISVKGLMPYALSFAAGAMIFVVIEELIPEAQKGGNTDLATMGGMIGFAVMMLLDLAFT